MKIVLAYSGGLDTSVLLSWIKEKYDAEMICFCANIGQEEELKGLDKKAKATGASKIYIDDLQDEFAADFIYPMMRAGAIYEGQYFLGTSIARPLIAKRMLEIARKEGANALYEGEYLLGTSIARPLIAKRLIEIAAETGADAIAHGATGKGNDQVRFELGAYALKPGVKVIAPWREWDLLSREKLLAYAETNGIPIDMKHRNGGSPYSMDANLLHISFEGRHLEDPAAEAEESMWRWTVSPEQAPDAAEYLDVEFAKGDIVALNGVAMSPAQVLTKLNELGGKHGIGRLDLVENRYVGMKSRGCYETPGGTIILKAHRAIESITLDREVAHLKDDLMPRYASMIYNGYWWSPERLALQALIDHTQQTVNGWVRLKLYKGNVIVVGRDSKTDSLFDPTIATFEDDAGAYDQRDAGGFIKLNALRMRIAANLKVKKG